MAISPASTVAHATLALLCAATALPSGASPALARDKRCLNCHAIDRKLVGPAFKEVARRYSGQTDAPARLADKIIKGGGGAWGPVPMAANPQVSPAEARLLATWVLSIR